MYYYSIFRLVELMVLLHVYWDPENNYIHFCLVVSSDPW